MLPVLTLEGRLTGDVELRFITTGKAVATFTIATSDRKKNEQTEQWEDVSPTFFRCTAWGQLAENVAESLGRGDPVLATGKLSQRDYETREGDKRTAYQEVTVFAIGPNLQLCTAKAQRAQRGSATPRVSEASEDLWGTAPPVGASTTDPPF